MDNYPTTHSVIVGYILWLFGFLGAHRFYFGKPITGTIWFFTVGLLLIGWIIDLFLIPGMARRADLRYKTGPLDYTLAWIFFTFLGVFGIHRFYIGKWITGIVYLRPGLSDGPENNAGAVLGSGLEDGTHDPAKAPGATCASWSDD
jgi:TM2 domain-containing membrane protein YozV